MNMNDFRQFIITQSIEFAVDISTPFSFVLNNSSIPIVPALFRFHYFRLFFSFSSYPPSPTISRPRDFYSSLLYLHRWKRHRETQRQAISSGWNDSAHLTVYFLIGRTSTIYFNQNVHFGCIIFQCADKRLVMVIFKFYRVIIVYKAKGYLIFLIKVFFSSEFFTFLIMLYGFNNYWFGV